MLFELAQDEIHVWRIDLDRDSADIAKFRDFLTAQEQHRAAKFINPIHGDRWTVARGSLRQILGQYLDLAPAQIVFDYGKQGKPELVNHELQFNLSHSRDRAVCGISAKSSIGIDLEYVHPLPAADLVDRFFSSAEQAIFHQLPVELQQVAFFHVWTQKEAYLKACGTGLSTSLDQVEVSIDPRTSAELISTPIHGIWEIQKLALATEYAGAIVVEGNLDLNSKRLGLIDRLKYQSLESSEPRSDV
jgi:4'-phosphopantetheinyl transferase